MIKKIGRNDITSSSPIAAAASSSVSSSSSNNRGSAMYDSHLHGSHEEEINENSEIEEIKYGDMFTIYRIADADAEFYECMLSASSVATYFQDTSAEQEEEEEDIDDKKYKSIVQQFFNNATAVIITYDVTNGKSFDNACAIFYPMVEQLSTPGALMMLIGTKSDRIRERAVGIEEVEEFSSIHNLFFMEVSNIDMTNIQLTLNILNIHSLSGNSSNNDLFDDEYSQQQQQQYYQSGYEKQQYGKDNSFNDNYDDYYNYGNDYAIGDDKHHIVGENEYSTTTQNHYGFSPPGPPPPPPPMYPPPPTMASLRAQKLSPYMTDQNYNHSRHGSDAISQMEYAKVEQLFAADSTSAVAGDNIVNASKVPLPPPPPPPSYPPTIPQPPLLSEKKKTISQQRLQELSASNRVNIKLDTKFNSKPSAQTIPKRSAPAIVDDRPILSKVDVVVGKGKTLTIFIREGDNDPTAVVENFKKINGFRSQRIADLVLQEVTRAFAKMEIGNYPIPNQLRTPSTASVNVTATTRSPAIPIMHENISNNSNNNNGVMSASKLGMSTPLSQSSYSVQKSIQSSSLRRQKKEELSNVQTEGARLTKAQQSLLFKTMGLGNTPPKAASSSTPSYPSKRIGKTPSPAVEQLLETEHKPLFNVEINMSDGKVEQIAYYEGDEFDEVARRFCEEHSLPESKILKLSALLQQTYQSHIQ